MSTERRAVAPRPATALHTAAEVAKMLGVTQPCVLAWIKSGELRAVNVARSATAKKPRWRVSLAAIEAFEAARTATPPTPKIRKRKREGAIQFYA